jgi:hypothetical protein
MRMLRWMCGETRCEIVRLEMKILEKVGVASIVEKMVENRFRRFGRVKIRFVDSIVRRVDQMEDSQITRGK